MHVAELRTVALVENDDDFLPEHRVLCMAADENRKFLNGRDDDFRLGSSNCRFRIAVLVLLLAVPRSNLSYSRII